MSTPSLLPPTSSAAPPRKDSLGQLRRLMSAKRVSSPHMLAAETLGKVFGADLDILEAMMTDSAKAVNSGSLDAVEATLGAQATTLNALFSRLTQVAFEIPRSGEDFATWFKLALRAQAQSAKALEILGNLKQGPKVVITSQLNAAHQQVVNNSPELPRSAKGQDSASGSDVSPRRRALAQRSSAVPDLIAAQTQPIKQYATLD